MAKKKINNEELVRLALDEHRWINTPVLYTTYGSHFTRFQQDVMLQVSGKLQDHFTKYLDERRYLSNERPKSGIAWEDLVKMEPLRLDLSGFGIGDSHYDEKKEMIESLENIFIHAPVFNKETGLKEGMDYMPLFSKVRVPMSFVSLEGKEYAYDGKAKYDKDGKELKPHRKLGYIELTINVEVAKTAFDMDKGYFNHLERIAYFCNSAYTSRLYLLLMKYVSKGQMHPAIDYFELKDFLGMYDRAEKSETIIKERYAKFAQFRKLVLDVARRDMERLCDENKIEIMLACTDGCKDGYEPLYRGMAKRGNPEKIKFHIKRTPLGVARELELHRGSSEQRLCEKLLELYPTLDEIRLRQFVSEVPEDVWTGFKKFAYNGVSKAVEQPHRWDGTNEEYIFYVMGQWLKQHEPNPQVIQQDLFSSSPDTDGTKEWQTFLSTFQGEIGQYFPAFEFCCYDGHTLTLMSEDWRVRSFNEYVEAHPDEYRDMLTQVHKVFGREIKIMLKYE